MELSLLERAGQLKSDLVEFAESEPFADARRAFLREQLGSAMAGDAAARINALDRFVLGWRNADCKTIPESFVASRPDLPEADRAMVLGWRNAVESLFEVLRHEGDGVVVVNLVNDLEYAVYSNRGRQYTSRLADGDFMHARIAPLGDAWVLSGAAGVMQRHERDRVYRMALQLATASPDMVFQNPDKLRQAWDLQKRDREEFVEFFGSDMVVIPRGEVADRMREYMRFKTYESRDAEGLTRAEKSEQEGRPIPPLPDPDADEYPADVETIGFVYDETEGQLVFYDLGEIISYFDDPKRLNDPTNAEVLREFIEDPELSPAPLYRLAASEPEKVNRAIHKVFGDEGFEWTRDADALLRRYKAEYLDQVHTPSVIPVSDRLTKPPKASRPAGTRKVGRNEPCPCGSGRKYKACCGR